MRDGSVMDRRSFVLAASASAAALSLAGCAPDTKMDADPDGGKVYRVDGELVSETGRWVPAVCFGYCGGDCNNRVFVEDGVVVRQKTDDGVEDSLECPQRRSCPRGRAFRNIVFGPDRIKYPMKRKSWSPDDPHGELRGKDEWERIGWDEALDIVAGEMKKAIEKYGSKSILLCNSYAYELGRFAQAVGGCTMTADTTSHGTAALNAALMGLCTNNYYGALNDRYDMENADTIILYGINSVWTSAGNQNYFLYEHGKEKGHAQFVYVGPSYNVTASLVDARWIPVRVGTDTAFCLAVAYEMFRADEERGGVIDWEFLEKYTVGIDGDHMPADAKLDENFKDYLYGAYDGVVHDAEWASAICGCTAEDIRWYANEMRKDNNVSLFHSYPAARIADSDHWIPALMTTVFMGGHMGKPGNCAGGAFHGGAWKWADGREYLAPGGNGLPALDYATGVAVDSIYPFEVWDRVLDKKDHVQASTFFLASNGGAWTMAPTDIHVIACSSSSNLNNLVGVMTGIEAYRSVDFVVADAFAPNPQAWYADIVLPKTTTWEYEGYLRPEYPYTRDSEALYYGSQVVAPLYEARDEADIWAEVLDRMGIGRQSSFPFGRRQRTFNEIAGSTYLSEDGEHRPLFSITQEDIDDWEVEGEPQEGITPFADFVKEGVYRVERAGNDGAIGYGAYFADPEANPRNTPSGKFEIYCQTRADTLNSLPWTDDGVAWTPYPSYKLPKYGYGSEEHKEYPFQVYTPNSLKRNHSLYDNGMWLREAFENTATINAQDAAELGIETGDTVLLHNQYGKILRQATVTNAIMRGTIAVPHGAWVNLDEETGIDIGGCDNTITPKITSGCGVHSYNSCLVKLEKWDGNPLPPDTEIPLNIIDGE